MTESLIIYDNGICKVIVSKINEHVRYIVKPYNNDHGTLTTRSLDVAMAIVKRYTKLISKGKRYFEWTITKQLEKLNF